MNIHGGNVLGSLTPRGCPDSFRFDKSAERARDGERLREESEIARERTKFPPLER